MLDYLLSRFNTFSLNKNGLTPENLYSRSTKEFTYSPNSSTLLIGIPGWGQGISEMNKVNNWAQNSDASSLTYEFPREILSDDHVLTEKLFTTISQSIRKDIALLKAQYKFTKCIILGVSLGSTLASMTYKENPDITDILLVCPGNNLAENMWDGCRTQHLRKSYGKQGITKEKLKEDWRGLANENNMPAPNTKINILYGTHDKVILYSEGITLADTLKQNNFKVDIESYPCGHYTLILYFIFSPTKWLIKYID